MGSRFKSEGVHHRKAPEKSGAFCVCGVRRRLRWFVSSAPDPHRAPRALSSATSAIGGAGPRGYEIVTALVFDTAGEPEHDCST